MAKKNKLPDWASPPLNPVRVGHKKAEHRKIVMPGLDTGTYDFMSPSVQPDMALAVPSLDDLMKKYLTNPLAHKAINLRANRMIGNGYVLKTADAPGLNQFTAEKAVKDCEMFQERINYVNFFRQSIINAYVFGNEWTELIYADEDLVKLAKAPKSILNLNHGDAKTLDFRRNYINNRIILDGQGEPAGYMQYIPDLSVFHHTVAHLGGIVSSFENLQAGKGRLQETQTLEVKNKDGDIIGRILVKPQYIYLQKDEIVHLAFNTVNDNFWGMSFLIPAYNSLVQLETVMNATSETINDMGYPKLDVSVGSILPDGTVRYATETELDAAKDMIQDPVRREGYAHGADWAIKYLQPTMGPGTSISEYPLPYITLAAIGLRTPRELLTGEGESNRATANQNGTDYEKDCAADQMILEEYIKTILGFFLKSRNYATDSNGNCIYTPKITWPVMVSEETALKQRLTIEKWQNGALTYNEFLKELNEPEIEDRERGDKYYDELHISAPAPTMDVLTASQGKTMAMHSLPPASEMDPLLNDKFNTEDVGYKKIIQNNVAQEIVTTSKKSATKIRDEIAKEVMQPTVNLEKMEKKIEKIGDLEPFEAKRIVRTEISNLTNAARLENAKNKGLTFKVWQAVIDDKTSALSKALDGQVKKINEDFEAEYAENGKTVKWKGMEPPEHPNCYDKETEVLTDGGWKFFRDVIPSDKICSLNPENYEIEYLNPVDYHQYHHAGKMYLMDGKTTNFCVTPDHKQAVTAQLKKYGSTERDDAIILRATSEMRWCERIPSTGIWKGTAPTAIQIGEYAIPTHTFCKFMAMWLSDGFIVSTRPNTFAIASVEKQDKIKEALKDFPIPARYDVQKVYFNDAAFYEYLKQFGHATDKFIPVEIKALAPEYLESFISSYFDSHTRLNSEIDGYACEPELSLFTVSRRMASDLGEVLLKAGHTPSYSITHEAGAESTLPDGRVIHANFDCYLIRRNTALFKNVLRGQMQLIEYDDFVYDVELPKNHILYVRRGGKCMFSGNSRCKVVYYGTDPSGFTAFSHEELAKISEAVGDLEPELVLKPSNRPELDKLTITLAERTGIPSNKFASHIFELLLLGFGAGALSVLPVKLPFKESEKRFYAKLGDSIKNKPNRQKELKTWLDKNAKEDAKTEILKLLGGKQ